jgi:hypothetical protein
LSELEKFGRFLIAQQADRSPVTFNRIAEELVCLAFDIHTQCLVELHVLNDTAEFSDARRESFHQRALTAMELYGSCFCRIIDVGEHDGMCYYATSVNDGEFLKDYVERVSPMDVPQALSIIIQMIDAVIEIENHARLLEGLRLSNLLVCRIDDSHVAMRILDLGLARPENPESAPSVAAGRKMAELSQILFYLLSGKRYVGDQPAQVNTLAGLPANLKVLMRQTLDGRNKSPENGGIGGPTTLRRYRTEMADAFSSVSQRISRSGGFRPIDVPPRLHPHSQLNQKFFGDVDLEEQLGDRYEIIEGGDVVVSPYARLVHDQIKDREVLIQFLPASRTLPIEHSTHAIKGMSQVKEETHPNLIQCRGFWEQDELVCIAEEAHNGFALPLLLADRGNLEPPEILILLHQLAQAYDQAVALDMLPKCLSLHSLEVHFPNESRFRVRELRKRHVDFWPEFRLKLRCHAILDSSVRLAPWGRLQARGEPTPEWLAKCDFVGIAEELVLGEQPPPPMAPGASHSLPENVVELRKFFEAQYRTIGEAPADYSFHEFIEQLASELSRLRPQESVEVVGTIVDGAIAIADAGEKKSTGSRRGGTAGAPRPMGTIPDDLGSETPADSELNPIARRVRGAAQPVSEEQEAISLGTIDDVEFDIGDSREVDPSLPQHVPESDESEDDEDPAAAPEKPARRKGWFFLR